MSRSVVKHQNCPLIRTGVEGIAEFDCNVRIDQPITIVCLSNERDIGHDDLGLRNLLENRPCEIGGAGLTLYILIEVEGFPHRVINPIGLFQSCDGIFQGIPYKVAANVSRCVRLP